MEGDLSQTLNSHGYLQDDIDFDSLINTSGWPTSTTPLGQYSAYQPPAQSHTPQNNFGQYQPPSNQASYQYDIPQSQQPSFHQMSYSNSPYTTQPQPQSRPQYQQLSRPPANDYNAATFDLVDPSLQQPHQYQNSLQPYSYPQQQQQPRQNTHPSISPHSLYASPASQLHQISGGNPHAPYQQPANGTLHGYNQPTQTINGSYYNNFSYDDLPQSQPNPIQYPSLPDDVTDYKPAAAKPVIEVPYKSAHDSSFQVQPIAQPNAVRPSSTLRVYRPELLAKKDSELRHPLNHAPFVVLTTLGGLKASGVNVRASKARKTKTGEPSLKKSEAQKRDRPRKERSTTGYQGTSRLPKAKIAKPIRADGSASKSVSPSETSSSEYESSSEDESDYEEEVKLPPVDISTVREIERPKDPAHAAAWDAIGIIWKDPNQKPSQEVVSEAVSKYGLFIMGFRNQIKAIMTKIDEAGEKSAGLPQLQKEQAVLLDALYQAISATLKHGAPFIVEQLGNHHQLVNALIATLRDCIKTNDYTGKLPKSTLELLAKFKTLSDELLKKCKLDGVQKRWVKKGDKETNQKFTEILANTVESQEKSRVRKAETDKKTSNAQDATKPRPTESSKNTAINPAKRPLEDTTNGKPTKKFAAETSANTPTTTKPVVTKKPTANLLGINTRPVAKPVAKPVIKKREPSPPQESKLGALLASIAKPVEAPRAPSAPVQPPETIEEKAKRERKESRRHLRVKFKEGPELEQIKLFTHEQEEDEGRQDDMLRDATDMHNEGMMHKKRATEAMDLDDDDYQPPDVEEPVFTEPKNIDFSQLPKISLFGPSYTTRGGDVEVKTLEQETQARREGLELLVIYTNPEDIPPSAKEPASTEEDGSAGVVKVLKQSSVPWHTQRNQELEHYGSERAYHIFATRVSIESPEERNRRLFSSGALPGVDHNVLSGQSVDKKRELELKALFEAFEALRGKAFPPNEPPIWMINPEQRSIWMEGYKRDNHVQDQVVPEQQVYLAPPPLTFAPPPNIQATQTAPPSIPQFPPPPLADIAQHMFAGFGNDKLPPPPPFDYNTWAAANNPQNQAQRLESERSRRDDDDARSIGKKKKLKNWERFDENGEYKGPKLPCRFYAIGQCRKGADCTYSHDMVPQA